MLLEHEFEVDALKESLRNPEAVRPLEEEVSRLRAQCEERDDTVAALKKKTRLLENAQEEKFHAEKDKIVRILEAGFAERERLAVAKAREEERAEAKREAEEESKAREEEEGRRREERATEAVEEARKGWEEEKAKVLKQQVNLFRKGFLRSIIVSKYPWPFSGGRADDQGEEGAGDPSVAIQDDAHCWIAGQEPVLLRVRASHRGEI